MNHSKFEQELRELINRHCAENESDTPDFILASYMKQCFDSFNTAVNAREKWYGRGGGNAATNDVVMIDGLSENVIRH